MNRSHAALFLPPVLALVAAVAYIEYRSADAERTVAVFCASIEEGLPGRQFVSRALAQELEVHDFGADSPTIIASRRFYGWREEIYECRGERDSAGKVRAVHTGRRLATE